jgi:hypothetical protein
MCGPTGTPHSICWSFALKYRVVINAVTADHKNNLRQLELLEREWIIAEQLCSVLKVRGKTQPSNSKRPLTYCEDSQGRNSLLLSLYAESRHGYTSHGQDRETLHEDQSGSHIQQSDPVGSWSSERNLEQVLLTHRFIRHILYCNGSYFLLDCEV